MMSLQSTTHHPSRSLTSFHLFPQLPAEIRLAIYGLSISTPRLVPVNYQSRTYSGGLPAAKRTQWGCTSTARIPALLHVCQEARAVALEHYDLSFRLSGPSAGFPSKIWFRKDGRDVMYFSPREALDSALGSFKHLVNLVAIVDRNELKKVRKLAVHEGLFFELGRSGRRSKSRRRRGENSLPDLCLHEFWSYVREKFLNVEEVMFLLDGQENHAISDIDDRVLEGESSNSCSLEESLKDFSISGENFTVKISRAAVIMEMETGWTAPSWKVLGHEGASTVRDIDLDIDIDVEDECDLDPDDDMELDEKKPQCTNTISKTDLLFQSLYQERRLWA